MGPENTRARTRLAIFVAAGMVAAIVIGMLAAMTLRKPILAWLVETHFASEGVKASVEIERFDSEGVLARATLGERQELALDAVSVRFDPRYWLPHIDSIEVASPRLHAQFDGKTVSFGSLRPLIDNLKKPRAKSWTDQYVREPLPVSLDDAHATVETPAGPIEFVGHTVLAGSRVLSADLRVERTTLNASSASLRLHSASLRVRGTASKFDASAALSATASLGAGSPVQISATVTIKALAQSSSNALALSVSAFSFDADAKSATGSMHIAARGTAQLAPDGTIYSEADISGGGGIEEKSARDLIRLIPVVGNDPKITDAVVKAAKASRFATDVRVTGDTSHIALVLLKPIAIVSDSGASLQLAPASPDTPWLAFDARKVTGGTALRMRGGGLPAAELAIENFALSNDTQTGRSLDAVIRTTLAVTTRSLLGAAITGKAHIAMRGQALDIRLEGCANVRLAALLLKGKTEVADTRAILCTDPDTTLYSATASGWHFKARLADAAARFPSAQAAISNSAGTVSLDGTGEGLDAGGVTLSRGLLSDRFTSRRFEPLSVLGQAIYVNGSWHGSGAIESNRHRTRIGTVTFTHTMASGRGEMLIDANNVRFVPNGFAPSDISPLLGLIARADGDASFHGQIAWNSEGITSGGELDVDKLQFASPIGSAHNTSTHIKFISLLPPETAPDQALGIETVDWVSPMSSVAARFHFSPKVLDLSGVSVEVAGGTAKLDPLIITLGASETISGTLRLSQIDLGQLLSQSNLATKVHTQAILSGTIPFSIEADGLRIKDGYVAATKPGRIAIERSLWTSGAISSNAMQDFAYQAMENLAFDRLTGKINSLPHGRLGLVLHIEGRNDPPNQPETRIGLFDLLQGKAFAKPVLLPKGTPIDLTLDTSLNFDELLRAYRAARSPTVGTTHE